MRNALAVAVVLVLTSCDERSAITEVAQCNRELGKADQHLIQAKAAQAAAEQRAQTLEAEVRSLREERAAAPVARSEPAPTPLPSTPVAETDPARTGPLRIGLSLHSHRDERWIKDKLTMLAEAHKRGIDLRVQVGDETAAKQKVQAENLISQGIKVLIITAHDARDAASIVDSAARAGVQVVCYDRLILDSPHSYYLVSFDSGKVGELMGQYLASKVPKGNYILLEGSPTDHNAKWVHQGAMKVLQPLIDKGAIKVVAQQAVPAWDPTETEKTCDKMLATGIHVDAVLAPSDGMASGCIKALAKHGLAGKVPVTGQDAELSAARRVIQGTQGMTIFKDTRELGKKAIAIAEMLARGKAVPASQTVFNEKRDVKAVLLDPVLVTRENLDEKLIDSGYLNREAVYRK